jgi:hypothetical protein
LEGDPDEITILAIAERVYKNKEFYETKVAKKTKTQDAYYNNKVYVKEQFANRGTDSQTV